MTDKNSEPSTRSDANSDYIPKDISITEIKKEVEESVTKEPDYEDKSPASFEDSLKLYGTIKKPQMRKELYKKAD